MNALYQEIIDMIRDVDAAKHEMLTLAGGERTNRQAISDASAHLDTVVRSTEEATNRIIDAVNAIGALADRIGGEEGEALRGHCTHIYEACNFQDLASQRIAKANKMIRALESHIARLLELFKISAEALQVETPAGDRSLLNGPALPENAASQEDIDALFKRLP